MVARSALKFLFSVAILLATFNSPSFGQSVNSVNLPSFTISWHQQTLYPVPQIAVQFAGQKTEPHFIVTLPDGSSFQLKSKYAFPNLTLPGNDLVTNAESTRIIVQTFARILAADQGFHMAYTKADSNNVLGLKIDAEKLAKAGFTQFDPIRGIFHLPSVGSGTAHAISNSLPGYVSRVHFDIPEKLAQQGFQTPDPIDVGKTTVRERLKSIMQFVLDRVVFSTKTAFSRNKAGRMENSKTWDEIGFQIGLKLELLGGLGKHNLSAVGGVFIYIGFNKRTRSIVVRGGFRQEKLGDGVGASFSGKLEPKVYRMNSEEADKADPRKGYAAIKGESWYPPGMPVGSAVLDTGRGFQSDGFAIGPNLADFGGGFAMNTVTNFEETQRVYTFAIPDPTNWLNSISRQFEFNSPLLYGRNYSHSSATATARCEGAFRSTVDSGF